MAFFERENAFNLWLEQMKTEIQRMPFDLVYLHSVYFVHAVAKQNNKVNAELINTKNRLLNHFDSLDQILAWIWIEKYSNGYLYTNNDKNEIQNLVEEYFDSVCFKYETNREEFLAIFREIEFEKELVRIRQQIEENIRDKSPRLTLLRRVVLYLYEIKKRTCRISSLSEALFQAIYKDSLKKKFFKALLVGVALAATGASIAAGVAAGIKIVSSAIEIKAAANTAKAAADKAAKEAALKTKEAADKAAQASSSKVIAAIGIPIGVAIEYLTFGLGLGGMIAVTSGAQAANAIENASMASVEAGKAVQMQAAKIADLESATKAAEIALKTAPKKAVAVGTVVASVGVFSVGKIFKTVDRLIKKYSTPNWDENKVYSQIVRHESQIGSDAEPLGQFEIMFKNTFFRDCSEEKDRVIFKLIKLNGEIRKILGLN